MAGVGRIDLNSGNFEAKNVGGSLRFKGKRREKQRLAELGGSFGGFKSKILNEKLQIKDTLFATSLVFSQ